MGTMVDTDHRMAEALRVLLGFAISDMPEWAPQEAIDARHKAIIEASFVLAVYDAAEPVAVAPMPRTVLREHADRLLALAS